MACLSGRSDCPYGAPEGAWLGLPPVVPGAESTPVPNWRLEALRAALSGHVSDLADRGYQSLSALERVQLANRLQVLVWHVEDAIAGRQTL